MYFYHLSVCVLTMPVVVPRTPASGMSASSHTSKSLLSSHEPRSSKSSTSLSPTSALSTTSSHSHYLKSDTAYPSAAPPKTRRALHYNTPQSALSPRSASTPHTATAFSITTPTHDKDMSDFDTLVSSTETQLEQLIVSAEQLLSHDKQRSRLGLLSGSSTANSIDELDDREQREVRKLIAEALKLEHGAGQLLHDIQRSVAEEKEEVGGGVAGTREGGSGLTAQSSTSALEHVREMSQYIALLEAKVDDLQSDIDSQQPALALSTAANQHKQQLQQQLDTERARYEALEDELHALQVRYRDEQQANGELVRRLGDVSGSWEASEVVVREEKERGARWLREREEAKVDKRQWEEKARHSIQREAVVQHECERRLQQYKQAKRDSVRMKVMGVLSVGLIVLWVGAERWMNEYLRSQPHLFTF